MPTQGNDRITVTPGLHDGLGGADDFYWPGGSATILGGDTGEAYDTTVYGTTTGRDPLPLQAHGPVLLPLTPTGARTPPRGNHTATLQGIERPHLG